MRIAVKLGYIGQGYFGYQRQLGKRTVEGCIIRALKECRLIIGPRRSCFSSAGRTDRGVSALGQVVAFDAKDPATAVCRRLGSHLPDDIFAWASTEVHPAFNPRREAREKTYLYLLDDADLPRSSLEAACRLFLGCHDFSSFSRPSERTAFRSVDRIWIEGTHPAWICFASRGFLWTQVRKMVSAIEAVARGDLRPEQITEALTGSRRLAVAPAPPENLILWDICYPGLDFRVDQTTYRRAKEFLEQSARRLEIDRAVRRAILRGISREHAPVA